MKQKTIKACIKIIQSEVKWCEENPLPYTVTEDFRLGFIEGLKQAMLLLEKARSPVHDDNVIFVPSVQDGTLSTVCLHDSIICDTAGARCAKCGMVLYDGTYPIVISQVGVSAT